MQLFEKLLADAQVNKEAYENLVEDILKARTDAKLNQGKELLPPDELRNVTVRRSPATNVLTEELISMNPQWNW